MSTDFQETFIVLANVYNVASRKISQEKINISKIYEVKDGATYFDTQDYAAKNDYDDITLVRMENPPLGPNSAMSGEEDGPRGKIVFFKMSEEDAKKSLLSGQKDLTAFSLSHDELSAIKSKRDEAREVRINSIESWPNRMLARLTT